MKNDQYFKFEVSLLNDDKVACMMKEFGGALSFGVYMVMLQYLRAQDTYEASCRPLTLGVIADRCYVEVDIVEKVLRNYGLFIVNEETHTFRSPYLDKVMENLEEKRKTNVENGKKTGRSNKHSNTSETPASKAEKPNENQKSKEEKSRCITTIINNNSSNTMETSVSKTAAVAVMIHSGGEEKQRLFQPVKTIVPPYTKESQVMTANLSKVSTESEHLPSFTPGLSTCYPSAIRPSAHGYPPVTRGLQTDYPPAANPPDVGLVHLDF